MHRTGTKHIVRYMQKFVVQWSVISKFTCILFFYCSISFISLLSHLLIFLHSLLIPFCLFLLSLSLCASLFSCFFPTHCSFCKKIWVSCFSFFFKSLSLSFASRISLFECFLYVCDLPLILSLSPCCI